MKVVVYTDGASRGNPGDAGAGAVVLDAGGKELAAVGEYIGRATNNEAEYHGLALGLRTAYKLGATDVECRLDSELVVKQMNGEYRVKKPELKVLHSRVVRLANRFESVSVRHVPRKKNVRADRLANESIDTAIDSAAIVDTATASIDELAARLYELASTLTDHTADGIRRALERGAIEVQARSELGLRTIEAALTLASRVQCVPDDTRAELCSLAAAIAERWDRV